VTAPRPFLRPLLVWVVAAPLLAASATLCFLIAPLTGGPRAFWWVAPRYIRLVAWAFGIRRGLEGWGNLPVEIREGRQAAVFIGNHASLFDPPLIISTLPCRPVFVAKRELAWVPFLGWVIALAGFIFIDRSRRVQALASLKRAARRIHGGQSIVAFPEGTRSLDGSLLPFKKGPFALALQADVPLIPIAIYGGAGILPKGDWRVGAGAYRMRVGTPILPSDGEDAEALREKLREALSTLLVQGA